MAKYAGRLRQTLLAAAPPELIAPERGAGWLGAAAAGAAASDGAVAVASGGAVAVASGGSGGAAGAVRNRDILCTVSDCYAGILQRLGRELSLSASAAGSGGPTLPGGTGGSSGGGGGGGSGPASQSGGRPRLRRSTALATALVQSAAVPLLLLAETVETIALSVRTAVSGRSRAVRARLPRCGFARFYLPCLGMVKMVYLTHLPHLYAVHYT